MLFSHAKAQETLFNLNDSTPSKQQKLITNARSLAIGNIELLDTYLSNQKYREPSCVLFHTPLENEAIAIGAPTLCTKQP